MSCNCFDFGAAPLLIKLDRKSEVLGYIYEISAQRFQKSFRLLIT
jgi:hypothetical protein